MSSIPSPDAALRSCDAACPLAAAPAIDRRLFLSQSVLAAAAAALAACGAGGGGDNVTSPATINGTLSLSNYPTLDAVGGVATTSFNGVPVAIVRTGASTFIALSRICPHQGTTIDVTSSGFYCPNHGAQFNSTGTWIGGQRTSNLQSYPATYDAASGTISLG